MWGKWVHQNRFWISLINLSLFHWQGPAIMALQSWQAGKRVCWSKNCAPRLGPWFSEGLRGGGANPYPSSWITAEAETVGSSATTPASYKHRGHSGAPIQFLSSNTRPIEPHYVVVKQHTPDWAPSCSCQATHIRLSPRLFLSSNINRIESHPVLVKQRSCDWVPSCWRTEWLCWLGLPVPNVAFWNFDTKQAKPAKTTAERSFRNRQATKSIDGIKNDIA